MKSSHPARSLTALLALLLLAAAPALAEDTPKPPAGMVHVPAGEFIMGSEVGDADESPRHIATTGEFFIDEYEVSNADFKQFDPEHSFREGRENFPAIVTWEQADAYAKSLGKRLPTEQEWEKTARGIDGRMFPWGDSYDPTFIQYDRNKGIGETIAKPKSPYGCYDMAGGAMEWTSSWYKPYPGNPIPSDKYGEQYKVLKGGTTFNDPAHMRCAHRFYLPVDDSSNYLTGFRCVKDVE
ncbi:MAG: SUMF1/EgtB/PvdO family nonheme iron enzyme [Candidatus Hydrogenedentes bacterium]|nr:SUMF1/EgtB/PvdO family nonheme iron enzyme [Candidatus Hydrogenedentota bacterium]